MRRLRDESGQVMALTVLCMAVMLGSIAFAVDIGILLYTRRSMQTAADSAAIAAASEIIYGDSETAADDDATQNGITLGGVGGATLTVTSPYGADPASAQVVLSQPQPTFFMKALNQGSVTVTVSAVATLLPTSTCIYTLGPLGAVSDISLANGASVSAPACSVLDDANGPNSIAITPGSTLTAKSIGVVGAPSNNGMTPAPTVGIAQFPDPLADLEPPAIMNCLPDPNVPANNSASLGPGCYTGLTVNNGATLALNPGTYIINGSSLSVGSGATITGSGVTLYLVNGTGPSTIQLGSTLDLTAPSTGETSGILFYEDRNDTQTLDVNAANVGNLNGIIYLPAAHLNLHGGGGTTSLHVSLVVSSVGFSDHGYDITPYNPLNGITPLSSARLTQ